MRLSLVAFLVTLSSSNHVSGFTIPAKPSFHCTGTKTSTTLALKSSDIINKARKAIGQEALDEPEFKFTEDILNDMKQSLVFLEDRVTKGSGSFSPEALQDFEAAAARIVDEMNAQYEEDRLKAERKSIRLKAPGVEVAQYPTPSVIQTAGKEFEQKQEAEKQQDQAPDLQQQIANASPPPPPPPKMPSLLKTVQSQQQEELPPLTPPIISQEAKLTPANSADSNVEPTSDEEGTAYDGKGGLGLASGTTNTYIIPGMEEMTGEEYRKALQQTVSARQEERRRATGGMIGNKAAHDYLDQLGWGGAASGLAGKSSKDPE